MTAEVAKPSVEQALGAVADADPQTTAPRINDPLLNSSGGAGEWVTPSSRPEHIQQLISGVDRYNPQNLETLHDYLGSQLDSGTYDCLANLAILKLYQFNPSDFNYVVVINILLKALTASPLPDFQLCLSLLGEASLAPNFPTSSDPSSTAQATQPSAAEGGDDDDDDEKKSTAAAPTSAASTINLAGNLTDPLILKLANLSNLLTQARFAAFWDAYARSEEYEEVRKYAGDVGGFEESVRGVVLEAVKGAFRSISEERMGGYLNLKGSALAEYIQAQAGWKLDGGKVIVPVNVNNEIKATVIREEITFDQFTKVFAQAA
ncbi:hypothetical protein CF327_g3028 [Tilletia walkeri]|uniref:Eukaryotic translation initiation factor 3 subunit K n=1 Tax=Tilletia walkeri TaxID=117179 RepID=A0A8X7T6V2_9BASI|nr:hypothetical protein CF327_g3028 [Tilletia walkeri]KAE8271107.1 hypothetical protein A4X09_0g1240 [Tilletia walkeri]